MKGLREVIVYGAGAAAAFAVDIALLTMLVEFLGLHYLLAATLSFTAGTVVVYLVSVRYAFAHRRLNRPHLEFTIFAALGGVGIVVNLLVIYFGVHVLQLHYLFAKILSAGMTFFANYGSRRLLLFTPYGRSRSSRIGAAE